MASPFVFVSGDRLSAAELAAACLDGHLVALGEAYVPADLVETAALRAASMAPVLGSTLAATHATAAWIHGAVDVAPTRHEVQRAIQRRLHHVHDRRLHYRDTAVAAEDLVTLGGAAVTSVARTVADLARTGRPDHLAALRSWAHFDPAALGHGFDWLQRHPRRPHRRAASEVLARIQEEVTR